MNGNIKLSIHPDAAQVAIAAAAAIAAQLRAKPNTVLGLATGSTPLATYAELVRRHREEGLSFAGVRAFNLDEYWQMEGDHPQSYRRFLNHHLFDQVDIRLWNTYLFDGMAADPALECQAFEAKIRALGGVDLWLLGIGRNGHIAYNEPGSPRDSRSRLIELSLSSIAAAGDGRFFAAPEEVPRWALTAGIATIYAARKLVLLATGAAKAAPVAAALQTAFDPQYPASMLVDHPDCTFILDTEAAAGL